MIKIKDKYPKGIDKLRLWLAKYWEALRDAAAKEIGINPPPADLPAIEIFPSEAEIMINGQHRLLFDFFSENGIEVGIDYGGLDKETGKKHFFYKIHKGEEEPIISSYFGRKETEEEAFLRSFEILENE